jgi:hypothetical protein
MRQSETEVLEGKLSEKNCKQVSKRSKSENWVLMEDVL